MQIKRAEFLVRTVSDRRELSASRNERLSRNMEQEQIIMLIVTVVALVYLPATFVSTFFSTDVIKYQDSDNPDGTFSKTAMSRWVQVTVPLTLLTGAFAWFARKWMQDQREGDEMQPKHRSLRWHSGVKRTLLPLYEKP
ncbi:Uu.00g021070.m01.CDS01 [Anthostomella pinea]|uniref:Uu.00g021070.m01.CDS01 n=1 Tax=Anthostomella pinea TaxID=933095 RepID=A0AAI8VZL8_9PEZI|nr:Uu.00g021070.m01.CDS01 [Anthostomella pinea]